jgi:GNAT superfamily N-acetyltransferase
MVIAKADSRIIGFALWFQSYDIHWGITGAIIAEMYVLPEWRGKCVAVWLVARIAKIIIKKGWTFINSMAGEDNIAANSLYAKLAVIGKANNYIVANKALRALSELDMKSPREIVKNRPSKDLNFIN